MTKLEQKLIKANFKRRIENNKIFYIKDMFIIKLNYDNTSVNRIETLNVVFPDEIIAIEYFEEMKKILEEIKLIEREIILEEI